MSYSYQTDISQEVCEQEDQWSARMTNGAAVHNRDMLYMLNKEWAAQWEVLIEFFIGALIVEQHL